MWSIDATAGHREAAGRPREVLEGDVGHVGNAIELGARRKNIWKANMLTVQARSSFLFADPEVFR